jgi:hypothetical protein
MRDDFPSFTSLLTRSALCLLCCVAGAAARTANPAAGALPMFFQPAGGDNAFVASGSRSAVVIRPERVEIALRGVERVAGGMQSPRDTVCLESQSQGANLRMSLVNANPMSRMVGVGPKLPNVHFLTGGEDSAWTRVRCESVYPGIDVVYYGNNHEIEYDFVVAPGASPSDVQLAFSGHDSISIAPSGDLVLGIGRAAVRQLRPVIYQEVAGRRVEVNGGYKIEGGRVGFHVASYRRNLPLVIDPVLSYSSYFGGNYGDISMVVRAGPDESLYIAGQTLSKKFLFTVPTNAFQKSFKGGTLNGDAFVARFDSTGSNLIYFTYLGGRAEDGIFDLAVDADGHAFVTGFTTSDNFPVRNALFPKLHGTRDPVLGTYNKDAFVAVLDPSGSSLVYSTYLGGAGNDVGAGIALDASGAAWVVGTSGSTNFPVRNPLPGGQRRKKQQDVFVSKFTPGGTDLIFSSYMGGDKQDAGQGIAVDSAGDAHLIGYTLSKDFPVTNAFQSLFNATTNKTSTADAWVAKISSGGFLLYSSFLGGAGTDIGYRVAVDAANSVYCVGYTLSKAFPNTLTNVPGITNSRASSFANTDAFLTKVAVNGLGAPEIAYSTVYGGAMADVAWDVSVTPSGDVHTIGITSSYNFPTIHAIGSLSGTNSGNQEIFLFALNAAASSVLYSGYFGARGSDYGYGITVLPTSGGVALTGRTTSTAFPLFSPAQSTRYGGNDAFLSILQSAVAPIIPIGD